MLDRKTYGRFNQFLKNSQDHSTSLVAIFDIGTKAARIIIAPKQVPEAKYGEWNRELFYNDSGYFKLGEDVDPITNKLDHRSQRLWKIFKFIQFYRNYLVSKAIVPEENIHVFGTEVFRWLSNQQEIVDAFKRHTSLNLKVLSEDEESFFSLISIQYTTKFANKQNSDVPDTQNHDSIFLIDQGGGSTEIAFFNANEPTINKHTSISKFGTIALKDIFFTLDSSGNHIDPRACNYSIPQQINSLNNYIHQALDNWNFYDEEDQKNKIFYGMGSALHNMVSYSNIDAHNKSITLDKIEDKIEKVALRLNSSYNEIRELYAKIEKQELSKRILTQLTLFYGLPVYAHLLRKFNVNEIRLAGFGLRYGIYIYLYANNRTLISNKILDQIPIIVKPEEIKKDNTPQPDNVGDTPKVASEKTTSNSETSNQNNRMTPLERKGLEENLNLLIEKYNFFKNARDTTSDSTQKFSLNKQLEETQKEINQVKAKLRLPIEDTSPVQMTTSDTEKTTENEDNPDKNEKKRHLLFLSADPVDLNEEQLMAQYAEIVNEIQKANITSKAVFRTRIDTLLTAIDTEKPSILHFTGHGKRAKILTNQELEDAKILKTQLSDGSGLILTDEKGKKENLDTTRLEGIFQMFVGEGFHFELVFLNACYSENQAKVIAKYTDYVIGTKVEVGKQNAKRFATYFYNRLAEGKTISQAFNRAKFTSQEFSHKAVMYSKS